MVQILLESGKFDLIDDLVFSTVESSVLASPKFGFLTALLFSLFDHDLVISFIELMSDFDNHTDPSLLITDCVKKFF